MEDFKPMFQAATKHLSASNHISYSDTGCSFVSHEAKQLTVSKAT